MRLPPSNTAQLIASLPDRTQVMAQSGSSKMTAAAQASLAEAHLAGPGERTDRADATRSLFHELTYQSGTDLAMHRCVPVTDLGPSQPFVRVLALRRSTRSLGAVSLELVATAMARSALTRERWVAADGFHESSRAVPSAGARHPHVLVLLAQEVAGLESGAWVLDPDAAVLCPGHYEAASVNRALDAVSVAMRLTHPPPAVVFTVARPSLTLGRYAGGMSLLWRDAGALLGFLHLAATDLGLGSCVVGTSGVLHMNAGDSMAPVDTGAVAIGTPP